MEVRDEDKIRCGEVFVRRDKLFIFQCSLCQKEYTVFSALLDHISNDHYIHDEDWINEETSERISIEPLLDVGKTEIVELVKIEEESGNEQFIFSTSDETINIKRASDEYVTYDSTDDYSADDFSVSSLCKSECKPDCYVCKQCNRQFKGKGQLSLHEISHRVERNYKCDECGMAFKSEYSLRAHQRRHSGIKDYDCSYCEKQFYTSTELVTHERRIHTGERPYMCANCGIGFLTLGLLKEHMKRHSNERPFKCSYCEKFFFNPRQRKEHEIVHTKERNHVCNVCNAKFGRRKSLLVHFKLHENAREYVCDLCEAAFNQRQSLIAHKKTKHKIISTSGKSYNKTTI